MDCILGAPNLQSQAPPKDKYIRFAYMNTWNARLAVAMKARGCNATTLAREIRVSNATVSDWMSSEIKKISFENGMAVCRYLEISQDWLLSGSGEMDRPQLTQSDYHAVKISRALEARERHAWYRAGSALAEPEKKHTGT